MTARGAEPDEFGRWRDFEGRDRDFLREVREVAKLHLDKDPLSRDAEIIERQPGLPGQAGSPDVGYLDIRFQRGPFMTRSLVGACDRRLTDGAFEVFLELIGERAQWGRPPELVYRGDPAPEALVARATAQGVWLRRFDDYQRVWDAARYLERQTRELQADRDYPLDRYIDKHWAPLGEEQPWESTAAAQLADWLVSDEPRFVLVLGDFGTGKTFLLQRLAYDLRERQRLTPVLVRMRDLQRSSTLDELIAQHMAGREDPFHLRSFRYLLRRGRIALLFDGFDELALRTNYDRVVAHFETLQQAAGGAAKVVVTGRHQYFATDPAVRKALPGSRIIRLFPLTEPQQRELVVLAFDGDESRAGDFLQMLRGVPDLLGLAANPRMLTYMIRWLEDEAAATKLRAAAERNGAITAGGLYQVLLDEWLAFEVNRQRHPGGHQPLEAPELLEAVTKVARLLWESGERGARMSDLGAVAQTIECLADLEMRPGEAAHALGSGTVLVRREDGEFRFIHQSVMEWLLARHAAEALKTGGEEGLSATLASGDLTPLMADFLCDLAGTSKVVEWAQGIVTSAQTTGPAVKRNAALILKRQGVEVTAVNYAGQDLRGRDFSGQDLSGAKLAGADLSGATLTGARLAAADLRQARLVGARLDRAVLTGADLTGTDLTQARMVGVNLRGAKLEHAVLDRAALIGAIFDPDGLAMVRSAFGAALPGIAAEPQLPSSAPVAAIAVIRDGEVLVTGHGDGGLVAWDPGSSQPLRTLERNTSVAWWLAAASDGAWLASGGAHGTVSLWDPATGRKLRILDGHDGSVLGLAAAPDGAWLASGGDDGTVWLWDPDTGRPLYTLDAYAGPIWELAAAPDGAWLASGGDDGTVWLWDPATGMTLRNLEGHTGPVRELVAAPDGRWLASAGDDGTVRLWDPATGRPLRTLDHDDRVWAFAAAPDGAWLASGGADGTVRLWDPATGEFLRILEGHDGRVLGLAVAPDGAWLASGGDDVTVRLWEPGTGRPLRTLEGYSDPVLGLAVAPDGAWLASGSKDGAVRLWDPATGLMLRILESHTGRIRELVVAPDGGWLASGGAGGTVWLWDPGSGEPLRTLEGHKDSLRGLAVAPDGAWLASCGDGTVWLWDPGSGEPLRTLEGHTDSVRELAVAPDGVWLASGGADGTVRLWDPATGEVLRTLEGHTGGVLGLAVAPDGSWLASGGDEGTVRLWDPATGDVLRTLEGHAGWVEQLAVAPDGRWLASGGAGGTVRLWDPTTGCTLRTIECHSGRVLGLAVAPNGAWLASGGDDGAVWLWDPATGEQLAALVGLAEGWAVLLPDGAYKLSGDVSGLWWASGLVRFEPSELPALEPFQPGLRRLADDAPILDAR